MASFGQIAKSRPITPIWLKSRMHGLFCSFWQILKICHQTRVLGDLRGEVQRTLAISHKTLFLEPESKNRLEVACFGQIAKSRPIAPILAKMTHAQAVLVILADFKQLPQNSRFWSFIW